MNDLLKFSDVFAGLMVFIAQNVDLLKLIIVEHMEILIDTLVKIVTIISMTSLEQCFIKAKFH
jgi:hypothetical protein